MTRAEFLVTFDHALAISAVALVLGWMAVQRWFL